MTRVELGLDATPEDAIARAAAQALRWRLPNVRGPLRGDEFKATDAKADWLAQTWFEKGGKIIAEHVAAEMSQRTAESGRGPAAAWDGLAKAFERARVHAEFMAERSGAKIKPH